MHICLICLFSGPVAGFSRSTYFNFKLEVPQKWKMLNIYILTIGKDKRGWSDLKFPFFYALTSNKEIYGLLIMIM